MKSNWKEDLLSEKSLREAYVVSKVLARSRFNWWAYRIAIVILTVIGGVWTFNQDVPTSFAALMSLTNTAFDLTVQILGFLIGGFAIFATISDSRLMVKLAQATMPSSDLSVFKTIFYNFISVFYIYVVTLSLSVGIRVASSVHIISADGFKDEFRPLVLSAVNSAVFVVTGIAVTLSILRLKSFIWNIYQAFLTLLIVGDIAREAQRPRSNEGDSHNSGEAER